MNTAANQWYLYLWWNQHERMFVTKEEKARWPFTFSIV